MFDPEVWDGLHPELRQPVIDSLITLAISGVFKSQIECQGRRLLAGSDSQSLETLAQDIQRFRSDARVFELLHETGLRFKQETENA